MRLFVGDDWAQDHHDVELMDAAGRVLARRRLPGGVAGMARLHELIGQQLGADAEDAEVVIGIETDRGPWVAALVAAGYGVYAVNPLQASRYRASATACPAPRATAVTRTCSPRWCAPIPISSVRWPVTARMLARSRWWPGPIRR